MAAYTLKLSINASAQDQRSLVDLQEAIAEFLRGYTAVGMLGKCINGSVIALERAIPEKGD